MIQLNIFEILGIPLINFEVNHFLNCSANCFIMAGAIDGQVQCNIAILTVKCQHLQQLIMQKYCKNWTLVLKDKVAGVNISQKQLIERQNQYLDYLIDPNFQGVNRLFVLAIENDAHWECYNCWNKILKCYDWWRNFFDHPVENDDRVDNSIRKIATGQGHDYATACLLDMCISKIVM